MTIESIALWQRRARPTPTTRDFDVALGCHFEEIVEMIEVLQFTHTSGNGVSLPGKNSTLYQTLKDYADGLKAGRITAEVSDRREFLDAAADQIVTAVGVGHCARTDIVKAVNIVNTSNWSKYSPEGEPYFDQNGKILKGPNYTPPHLEGLY